MASMSARGMSKSISSEVPIYSNARSCNNPSFHNPRHSVCVARIAVPSTSPVSVCSPDGMSILMVGFDHSFMVLIADAMGSVRLRSKPKPNKPSIK